MKKLLLLLLGCSAYTLHAQTTLFSEDFNGSTPAFTINSSDVASTTSGYNSWIINTSFLGGSYTDNICTGFSVNIASTPSQPAGITGSPASKYLHIVSNDANSQGVGNANFLASDGGAFCVGDENYFAKMNSDISTTGETGVSLSFYWLCAGSSASYGEVYYSTDGGNTWFLQQSNMRNQSAWTQATITNALWDNQASLRFGFRFVNGFSFSASDPSFAIDEIKITVPAAAAGITTGTFTNAVCSDAGITVPYTVTGTFNPGNIFTAQLSDITGSFASPTSIGSTASTTSGSITATIPAGLATGNYQIRVVGSIPNTVGTSSPISINAQPVPVVGNSGPYCAGSTINLTSSGGATYTWTGPNSFISGSQNPSILSSTVGMSGTYTVQVTDVNGCSATGTTTVVVDPCTGVESNQEQTVSIYPNPAGAFTTIRFPESWSGNVQISVMNQIGQKIGNTVSAQKTYVLNTGEWQLGSGLYLVEIEHEGKKIVRKLLVK